LIGRHVGLSKNTVGGILQRARAAGMPGGAEACFSEKGGERWRRQ
jgi:hypothetical protein